MKKKLRLSRKTQKIILGICIAAMVLLGAGLFAYIQISDNGTLGRGISIYGLDVSKLNAEEAEQKILRTFLDREVVFQEDGEEVFRTNIKELGYSLDEEILKNSLQKLQVKRASNRRIFAVKEDYEIMYQVTKNETQEKNILVAGNFGGKERSASKDAYISYDEGKQEFVLVKEVQGNQIDEARLLTCVDQTLDNAILQEPLGGQVDITIGTEVYQQPVTAESQDMQAKLTSLNQQLSNYRNASVTYTFGETTEVLGSDVISSWISTVLPTPAPPNRPILPPFWYGVSRSITLMPVSKISTSDDWSAKLGGVRWISQCVSFSRWSSMSSIVSPVTLNRRPSVFSPTGTEMEPPVAVTGISFARPSDEESMMQRTVELPMCCATSMVRVLPPDSTVSASLIFGSSPVSNATSTTGPMTCTIFPLFI